MKLVVDRVSKRYGRGPLVLKDVSLEVAAGETLALIGESGSGKSTLARIIVGLIAPTSGRVTFDGLSGSLRRQVQIVFQDPYSSLDPRMTVERAIGEALVIHGLPRSRLPSLLEMVQLEPSLAERYPHELSGGQRQRVAIARALAVSPSFLVLDEPLSALDLLTQAALLELFLELRAKLGLTYFFISHDLRVVRRIATRVLVMKSGSIVE